MPFSPVMNEAKQREKITTSNKPELSFKGEVNNINIKDGHHVYLNFYLVLNK